MQFYGYMSQQQNMMQDYIRTSTYQRAMLDNMLDFQDKVRRYLQINAILVNNSFEKLFFFQIDVCQVLLEII